MALDEDQKTTIINRGNATIAEALEPKAPSAKLTRLDDAGGLTPEEFWLATNTQTIGRDSNNAIQLNSSGISKAHARVFSDSGGWFIEDLASRNGVWVNGGRITKAKRIGDGDVVQVSQFIFRLDVVSAFEATHILPSSPTDERPIMEQAFGDSNADGDLDIDANAIRAGVIAMVGAAVGESYRESAMTSETDPIAAIEFPARDDSFDLNAVLYTRLEANAERIADALVRKALDGDPVALSLAVQRLWPLSTDGTLLESTKQVLRDHEAGALSDAQAEAMLRNAASGSSSTSND